MPYKRINTWIFDMDNTLYCSSSGLMDQVDKRIATFVAECKNLPQAEADEIRKHYWHHYGTTLGGLIANDGVCHKTYFDYIFDELDYSVLNPCEKTREHLKNLPGTKVIYTNGEKNYAERVLTHLNLHDVFEGVYDVTWADLRSKPEQAPYEKLLAELKAKGTECAMIEDSLVNLEPAKNLGMHTVLIHKDKVNADFVDEQAENVLSWLANTNKVIKK